MATSKVISGTSLVTYLEETDGHRMLTEVQKNGAGGYQPILHAIFTQQTTRGGCGITSCALVLSANSIGCSGVENVHHRSSHRLPVSDSKLPSKSPAGRREPRSADPERMSSPNVTVASSISKSMTTRKVDTKLTTASMLRMMFPSLVAPFTELGLYEMPATMAIARRESVSHRGLTLSEVAAILHGHGCTVRVVNASSSQVDQFRRDVASALSDPDSCSGVIVNFHRGPLSTGEGSHRAHHSPLVAYHRLADCVLVLDTAAPPERHFWVSCSALFTAMSTVDSVSGISRGYCVFSKTAA